MAKKPSENSATPAAAAKPYVVLARKYRPQTFADLIGQDAMVQTLRNAFTLGRIAQGYMLTGVRGVGKTTTARILARALNYEKDGIAADKQGPTIDMDGLGRHCAEIIESRHPDVLEMDAASNTGIDNIREIIESARYKPILARTKVFIIDEVHMLSKGAFNALLKTLEEPPEHVKFIFATTELRKVPVTVLSRCQRFDLRRVDVAVLSKQFEKILAAEGASAEPDAVALIARAAEGSVRDGLSILDQAIAMGSGQVSADQVRAMLGLADRGRVFDLLEQVLGGQAGPALLALAALHKDGAEPLQTLADLAEAVHITTRLKIAGAAAGGEGLSAQELARAGDLAGRLSQAILARAWQMLIRGIEEAAKAPDALAAAEMVLVRLAYTADLPTPDDLVRRLGGASPAAAGAPARGASAGRPRASDGAPQPARTLTTSAPKSATPPARGATAAAEPPPWDDDAAASRGGVGPPPNTPPPFEQMQPVSSMPPTDDSAFEPDAEIEYEDETVAARPLGRRVPSGPASPRTFAEVVQLARAHREAKLLVHLEEHVSLVKFEPAGTIELHMLAGAPTELANELREKLNTWTHAKWMIAVSKSPGAMAIGPAQRATLAAEIEDLKKHPAMAKLLAEFPDAKITGVHPLAPPAEDETGTG